MALTHNYPSNNNHGTNSINRLYSFIDSLIIEILFPNSRCAHWVILLHFASVFATAPTAPIWICGYLVMRLTAEWFVCAWGGGCSGWEASCQRESCFSSLPLQLLSAHPHTSDNAFKDSRTLDGHHLVQSVPQQPRLWQMTLHIRMYC